MLSSVFVIDEVEIIAKKYAVVLSHFEFQHLINFEMKLLCVLQKIAIVFLGD
jgi:hypothetical protein